MSKIISESLRTTDGQIIHYDLYCHGHQQLIIVAHGFFNNKDAVHLKELEQALADQFDVLIMDFRGHGKSGGLFYWTSKEYLDLQAVLEHAKSSYKKIGVIGFSLLTSAKVIELIPRQLRSMNTRPQQFRRTLKPAYRFRQGILKNFEISRDTVGYRTF